MREAVLRPSSAQIWGAPMGCTVYPAMAYRYKQPFGDAAKEGIAAHEIAADGIKNLSPDLKKYLGTTSSNGIIITQEMIDAAEEYVNDVVKILIKSEIVDSNDFGVEHRIKMNRVHPILNGVVDAFIFDKKTGEIYLWDFKYGHGVVEVYDNYQLINYAAGLLDYFEINGNDDQHIHFNFRIVQPRAYHKAGTIREWRTRASMLRGHINILSSNAEKALSDKAEARTGEHCRYCPGRHACKSALEMGMSLYEITRSAPANDELSPEAMAIQFEIISRAKKQLEYLYIAYEDKIKDLLLKGKKLKDWTLAPTSARENWIKKADEIIRLGELVGINLKKPDDVITPKQARKLGIDEQLLKKYSEQIDGALKLTKLNHNEAKEIFSHE